MDETEQYIWNDVIPDIDRRIKRAGEEMVSESELHGYGEDYRDLRQDFRDLKNLRHQLIACAEHNYFDEMNLGDR